MSLDLDLMEAGARAILGTKLDRHGFADDALNLIAELRARDARIKALEAELWACKEYETKLEKELATREVHTCHAQCQRPACVEGRRLRKLLAQVAAVVRHTASFGIDQPTAIATLSLPVDDMRALMAFAPPPGEPA